MRKRSKWKRRRKIWLDCKNKKLINKNRRKKHSRKKHIELLILPEYFSLTNNTEETMSFIMKLSQKINKAVCGSHIFIDSHKVKLVTVEALIYLIASIQNNLLCSRKKILCTGNYPKDKEARKIYLESGFNDYVRSRVKSLPHPNEKMEIKSGLQNIPTIAKQCCIFTRKTRTQTQVLYTILIELMSNAFHHAYNHNRETLNNNRWYVYAEHADDCTRFIFVDTGLGIAKTVRKNFPEKIQQIFGELIGSTNDAQLIQSTFNGDFRTKTNQENRGNGLATIKNFMSNPPFSNFEVISGHGKYSISGKATNYHNKIYGTLFTFEIR